MADESVECKFKTWRWFCDFGSIHMLVTVDRTVSTQNTAGDHVKTSSRVIRSGSYGICSNSTRSLHNVGLGAIYMGIQHVDGSESRGRVHWATAKKSSTERAGVKEASDTGDEDEKEKVEELTADFGQLTHWFKDVFGDKLKSTSKELMDIGVEPRIRTTGQLDDGIL